MEVNGYLRMRTMPLEVEFLEISGHGNKDIMNSLLRIGDKEGPVSIILPGLHYNVDMPILLCNWHLTGSWACSPQRRHALFIQIRLHVMHKSRKSELDVR